MGKESLIKSTTKPEDSRDQGASEAAGNPTAAQSKSKTQASKTTAAKKPAAKKSAAKSKATSRKKPAAKAKAATPKKPAVKAKAATRKKPPQKAAPEVAAAKTASKNMESEVRAASREKNQEAQTPAPAPQLPPGGPPPPDPTNRMMQFGLAGFALLVLLVIVSSWLNTRHYYIQPGEGAIEIWQGKFAPKGARLLISIPGATAPEPLKDSYSRQEVYPIFYQYHLDKADALLEVPGMPDFEGVKSYLHAAERYAVSSQMQSAVESRLNAINRMVLIYKADVAASKDTIEDLKTARRLYKEARDYATNDVEAAHIKRKIEAVDGRMDELKSAAALEKANATDE